MDLLSLPHFDDAHRALFEKVKKLCDERLGPLSGTELEDVDSSAVEYVALLGQEGLFDPALGRALEGEAPRPELRSLCVVRSLLGRTSGLCDGVYGAHVQGLYPIALCGNEDQRAIFLPSMAAGQKLVGLGLLDGEHPLVAQPQKDGGYLLRGEKAMVPLAPIADHFVVLARLPGEQAPRWSLFVVDAGSAVVEPEALISPLPVGRVSFPGVELDAEQRLGGEGQGLIVAQAALDMMRLPTGMAALGLARHTLERGTKSMLKKGIAGRPLREQQVAMWRLADALAQIESAEAMTSLSAYRRDATSSRDAKGTAMARQLAQDAAESACTTVADLVGLRGLEALEPWTRLLAEVRALRLETEFLEAPRAVVANALIQAVEAR